MIKSNDLRIGNNFKYEYEVITLYGIEDKSVQILKPNMNNYFHKIPIDWIEPIPLTEEILLKCGFVSKSIYDDLELNGFKIQSTVRRCDTNERSSFFLNLGEENESLNNRIDYLHQLQNLYWFLYGKELNVNI